MTNKPNYFDLFDLPTTLPVDQVLLSAHYQRLQRHYHPDNFAVCPDSQRQAMLKQSADINKGYHILKDPIQSADYLLSLHGIQSSTEKNISHDLGFLQEQFELREQLDTIDDVLDSDEKTQQLKQFELQINTRWHHTYTELLRQLDQSNWSLAAIELNKLRFLKKLQHEIERLEDQFFDL